MGEKLTDASVRELPAPERGNRIYYDTEVGGFGCRVTAAGAKSFVLNYRIGRKERRCTIGPFPTLRVVDARKRAKKIKGELLVNKVDPLADRDSKTVKQMAARYVEEHLDSLRERTREDYTAIINKEILPELGRLKVVDVTDDDVAQLHRKIAKRAPYRANRTVAVLSSMYALAIRPWRWCTTNPCRGVKRADEHPREKFLENGETGRLLEALAAYEDQQVADVLRMAMVTGARVGEIVSMRWQDVGDLNVWNKPHTLTKQKRSSSIPLPPPARELLARQPRIDAQVFPGTTGSWRGKLGRAWPVLRRIAELGDLRVHDLRHNYASTLVNAGYSLPVIGALLGHSKATTTARYSHLYRSTLAEAAERAANNIVAAGKPAVEPVPFQKRRRT